MDPIVEQALLTYAQPGKPRRALWSVTFPEAAKETGAQFALNRIPQLYQVCTVGRIAQGTEIRATKTLHVCPSIYALQLAVGLEMSVTFTPLGFLNDHASELVALVFATAPIYFDASSRRLVKDFIQQAIANSDIFLKTFAAGLITFDPSKKSKQVRCCK